MKRTISATMGLLALGVLASSSARADFAVVRFGDHWCRVWSESADKPVDGKLLTWKHKLYHVDSWDKADKAMQGAVSVGWCHH